MYLLFISFIRVFILITASNLIYLYGSFDGRAFFGS